MREEDAKTCHDGRHSGYQKERCPAVETFPGEQPVLHDEARTDPGQADQYVQQSVGGSGHAENHGGRPFGSGLIVRRGGGICQRQISRLVGQTLVSVARTPGWPILARFSQGWASHRALPGWTAGGGCPHMSWFSSGSTGGTACRAWRGRSPRGGWFFRDLLRGW